MQQLIEELRSRGQGFLKLGADALQEHSKACSITAAVLGTAFVLWVLLYATVMYLQEVKSMGKVTVLKVSTMQMQYNNGDAVELHLQHCFVRRPT
jgi:hypothetical protein